MENDKVLSIGEAAKMLGVSIQTLRRWDSRGTFKSFRFAPAGNRFYKEEDLKLIMNDLPALAWKWASQANPVEPAKEFYCRTKDIFAPGRLSKLEYDLQKIDDLGIHHSLLSLMVGEIGDNSYAHNLGNWPDTQGIFFAYDLNKRVIVLADRGRGILKTLQAVRPGIECHAEALTVAFTQVISGRYPEQRGNGLKSVRQIISTSSVKLTFRTGDAELNLQRGDQELKITECETFHGCLAILKF